jgi:hypothetical protein
MIVLGSELETAEVTPLHRQARTSESPEDVERPLRGRWLRE